jgi:hypothetical protein
MIVLKDDIAVLADEVNETVSGIEVGPPEKL